MKIAILGSAPSSLRLAPIEDQSWHIWGCSPGVYAAARRVNAWFELHRWEPGVAGRPETQKPWFSPEYVAWMANLQCTVWMATPNPQIPNSKALDVQALTNKYGTYFFTSSIAWMIACAIEDILEARTQRTETAAKLQADPTIRTNPSAVEYQEPDTIGLWGVDMAANEEYGYQRAGCQHFLTLAATLGIHVAVPPESDLLRPMPLYGIQESSHWHIKNTARKIELETRLAQAKQLLADASRQIAFLEGALDDMNYQMLTWAESREGVGMHPLLLLETPIVKEKMREAVSTAVGSIGKIQAPFPYPYGGEAGGSMAASKTRKAAKRRR